MTRFTYQHGCSQIELMEELSDENMHFKYIGNVFSFDVSEDINEPLKVAVRRTNPQKVDLLTSYPRVAVGGGTEYQVVEDRGVGGHTDTPAYHNGYLKLVPILVTAPKRTLDPHLGRVVFVLLLVIDGLVKAAKDHKDKCQSG